MKKNYFYYGLFVVWFLAAIIFSCTTDDEFTENNQSNVKYEMRLKVMLDDYNTTRSSYDWSDGAKLYLQFYVDSKIVMGHAIYDKTVDHWFLTLKEDISNISNSKCEAYYFKDFPTSNNVIISLSQNDIVYHDTDGTYSKQGDLIDISLNLSPKMGRIRFKGQVGKTLSLRGLNYLSEYNSTTNKFAETSGAINTTISSDGYSPYIYASFTDANSPVLYLEDEDSEFVRTCSSSVLASGKSGYMDVPTLSSYGGWQYYSKTPTYTVSGVTFKMVKVDGGLLKWRGDNRYAELSDYMIGETEVTQELWTTVMGTNPSSNKSSVNLPVDNVSYNDCLNFVSKLNTITNMSFNLPTPAQWRFAKSGGNKSKGFKYSGSNTLDEVAWYDNNSNGKTHVVKGKKPNELGLYDMTGNVAERCFGYYDYSWDSSTEYKVVKNPVVNSGENRVAAGGDIDDNSDSWLIGEYYTSQDAFNFMGLRLAHPVDY